MEDPKNPLPPWLPWATTAGLAALLACVGELLTLEHARSRLLRDQNLLAEAALKGAENQLEAERILERRELAEAGLSGLGIELLGAVTGSAAGQAPRGVIVWEPGGRRAVIRVSGLPDPGPDGAYQLWQEGPDGPVLCSELGAGAPESALAVSLRSPVAPGSRFLVVLGEKGAQVPSGERPREGSIVLATLPSTGKIPLR